MTRLALAVKCGTPGRPPNLFLVCVCASALGVESMENSAAMPKLAPPFRKFRLFMASCSCSVLSIFLPYPQSDRVFSLLRLVFPASSRYIGTIAALASLTSSPSPQKGHPCKPSSSSGPLCGSRSRPARSTATLARCARRSRSGSAMKDSLSLLTHTAEDASPITISLFLSNCFI